MTAQKSHAGNQPNQPEIMVPMQVGNKNMVDPATADLVFVHLRLGAFTAIDEEKMVIQGDHLGGRMPVKSRYGRIISKYGYCEHRQVLGMINRVPETLFSEYWMKNNTKSNRKRI